MKEYRGFKIERYKAHWLRSGRRPVKYAGWLITNPDGGTKVVDTLGEAIAYIDAYMN